MSPKSRKPRPHTITPDPARLIPPLPSAQGLVLPFTEISSPGRRPCDLSLHFTLLLAGAFCFLLSGQASCLRAGLRREGAGSDYPETALGEAVANLPGLSCSLAPPCPSISLSPGCRHPLPNPGTLTRSRQTSAPQSRSL